MKHNSTLKVPPHLPKTMKTKSGSLHKRSLLDQLVDQTLVFVLVSLQEKRCTCFLLVWR